MNKRQKYPIDFKVRVLQLWIQEEMRPIDAFVQVQKEHDIDGRDYEPKISVSTATTRIRGYETEIKAKLWDHDHTVHKLCEQAKLFGADWMTIRGFHQYMMHLAEMRK